jgi:hypothetical protein
VALSDASLDAVSDGDPRIVERRDPGHVADGHEHTEKDHEAEHA